MDNSGFDIILGVLPFVVELLKSSEETKVILCANSKPAINDITCAELVLLMRKVCAVSGLVERAFRGDSDDDKRLLIVENGSASPCLDLSRINIDLAELMKSSRVDLVILEGMGRAIHTNYNARFKCDCLKVAVLKNQWLANRFGFHNKLQEQKQKNFPIVFKFETTNA